jgi:cysteine-S-conjugate beta-lyase
MKYDFDRVIDRTGTGSIKWDLADVIFGGTDLLPLWVADMDFESPPEVTAALVARAQHGIFGYSTPKTGYYQSLTGWFRKRHSWDLKYEWLYFAPGVVPAINLVIQTYTEPGDRIIIQKPVYYPFMLAIMSNGREILNNPLKQVNGGYRIDFDDLERKAKDPAAKLMILCSPHNPVGRVWTRDELNRVGEICCAHDVLILSDEIHCDLTYINHRHIPFGSISNTFLMNSITCISPSKTFNLAGLQTAGLVIANPELGRKYKHTIDCLGLLGPNLFGAEALTAAYEHGEPWLDAVMEYVSDNLSYLKDFISKHIPRIAVIEPEGTYLVWLDFRALSLDNKSLKQLMLDKARVALDDGFIFGSPEGDGFMRINIACPRATLAKALQRIEQAVR